MSKWVVGGLAVGVAAAVGAYYLSSSSSKNEEQVSNTEKETKQIQTKQTDEPNIDDDEEDVPIDKLTPEQKEMLLTDRYALLAEISEWMKKDPTSGTETQLVKFLNKNVYRLDDGFIWMAERLALVDFADEQAEILVGVALLGARIDFKKNEKYRIGVIEACVNTVRTHLKAKGQISRYIDLTKFLITVYTQHVSRYTGYEEDFAATSNKILACWESIAAVVSEQTNPEEYASVQLNLGVVYSMLGNDADPESQKHLHSAITCCNNALKYFNEEKHKEQYGQLHKVLGTAYWALHNIIRSEHKESDTLQDVEESLWNSAPDYESDEEDLAKMLQAHLGFPDEEEEEEMEESRVQEIDSDEEKAINEENERKQRGLPAETVSIEQQATENNTNVNGTNNKPSETEAPVTTIPANKAPQQLPMSPEESVYVEKAIDSLEKAFNVFNTSKQTAAVTIMMMQLHSHLTELYSCRDQGDAEENRNKARFHSDKALEIIGKMRRQ